MDITVNNIDKTAPIISNVENDRLYMGDVTPKIQDENLAQVSLYKNKSKIENYQVNNTIKEDGNYILESIDKAGNSTRIEFYISREPVKLKYSQTQITN